MTRTLIRRGARAQAMLVIALTAACALPSPDSFRTVGSPAAPGGGDAETMRPAGDQTRRASHAPVLVADTSQLQQRLGEIVASVQPLKSFERARAGGWTAMMTECMVSPQGGQGFHFGNPELIGDGAKLDPMRPELLMYEPQADGSMELVGIEYIIPIGDWTTAEPPMLLGRPMHVNEKFGLWVLHIWLRPNAAGIYSDWNAAVGCVFADRARITSDGTLR